MKPDKSDWLKKVSTSNNYQELSNLYDQWSTEYDEILQSYGYITPGIINGFVGRYIHALDAQILDAGVGTGLIGQLLAILGYTNLVGIDLSPGMLQVARDKQVYSDLRQMMLGGPLDFPDNHFDAVVSTGTFSQNHAPPESFDELVRIVKPDGFIIFAARVDDDAATDKFRAKMIALAQVGQWELVEESKPFQAIPFVSRDRMNQAFIYRVLAH